MKFGRILGLSFAAMLVAASAAHAQDDMGDLTTKRPARKQTVEEENNDPTRSGVILGVGAAYALDNFDGIGASTDGSGAFNIHVGYRHNALLATEMQVERYQEFDAHSGGIDVGEVNGWAIGLNERIYPIGGRFQPFGLIGINLLDLETTNSTAPNPNKTDDGAALRFGVGLDVYATNKVVVSTDVSYMLGLGEVSDYDIVVFSLGLAFRP